MFILTQEYIYAFYDFAIRNVSNKMKIEDTDFKSTAELLVEIGENDKQTLTNLEDFLKAYQEWYDAHAEIDKAGTTGNPNPVQYQKLVNAINNRDETRKALIQILKK